MRRPFTILSALSLLLFIAVVALSARSCFVADDLRVSESRQEIV